MLSQLGPKKLLVVTKKQPGSIIEEVIDCGVKKIGENRVEEIRQKYTQELLTKIISNKVELHFIGHLQSKKVKALLPYVNTIQSVDSVKLAIKINECAKSLKMTVNIFLQVNATNEPQKSGFTPSDVAFALAQVKTLSHLKPIGLMCMGKQGDASATRFAFHTCRSLAVQLNLPECSMGMSDDYQMALDGGATQVRLGSLFFNAQGCDTVAA